MSWQPGWPNVSVVGRPSGVSAYSRFVCAILTGRCLLLPITLEQIALAWRYPSPMSLTNGRSILPTTRSSVTHKFAITGHEGYLTIGLFEDGQVGEIFIKMSKEGSTLSGLIQGFCRAFSLALQHGLSTEDAVERFRGMRFEPMGPTSNPEIPQASSILDYVARYLEVTFIPTKP